MGTHGDSSLSCTVPDLGNRCYASFGRVRMFWFICKILPGRRVEMEYQRDTCYGDHRKCRDYLNKLSESEES